MLNSIPARLTAFLVFLLSTIVVWLSIETCNFRRELKERETEVAALKVEKDSVWSWGQSLKAKLKAFESAQGQMSPYYRVIETLSRMETLAGGETIAIKNFTEESSVSRTTLPVVNRFKYNKFSNCLEVGQYQISVPYIQAIVEKGRHVSIRTKDGSVFSFDY